jgi:hypothetical protein
MAADQIRDARSFRDQSASIAIKRNFLTVKLTVKLGVTQLVG